MIITIINGQGITFIYPHNSLPYPKKNTPEGIRQATPTALGTLCKFHCLSLTPYTNPHPSPTVPRTN